MTDSDPELGNVIRAYYAPKVFLLARTTTKVTMPSGKKFRWMSAVWQDIRKNLNFFRVHLLFLYVAAIQILTKVDVLNFSMTAPSSR